MKFTIGERVSILNETGSYLITEISDTKIKVEDEHGFDSEVPISLILKPNRLTAVELLLKMKMNSILLEKRDLNQFLLLIRF